MPEASRSVTNTSYLRAIFQKGKGQIQKARHRIYTNTLPSMPSARNVSCAGSLQFVEQRIRKILFLQHFASGVLRSHHPGRQVVSARLFLQGTKMIYGAHPNPFRSPAGPLVTLPNGCLERRLPVCRRGLAHDAIVTVIDFGAVSIRRILRPRFEQDDGRNRCSHQRITATEFRV